MSGGDWKQMFKGIQENDYGLVEFYLKLGIDPNYQHPECMALPLIESFRFNNIKIAELLLINGANPSEVEMESGLTPIAYAQQMPSKGFLELIYTYTK